MSVCVNHPDVEAEFRCYSCRKPICADCVVQDGDLTFCSATCNANHKNTSGSVAEFMAADKKEKFKKKVRNIIILIILVGAGYAAYKYFSENPDKFEQLKQKAGEISENVQEKADGVKDNLETRESELQDK